MNNYFLYRSYLPLTTRHDFSFQLHTKKLSFSQCHLLTFTQPLNCKYRNRNITVASKSVLASVYVCFFLFSASMSVFFSFFLFHIGPTHLMLLDIKPMCQGDWLDVKDLRLISNTVAILALMASPTDEL